MLLRDGICMGCKTEIDPTTSMVGKTIVLRGEPTKWIVLEDNGNRVLVRAIQTNLTIPPTEVCFKSNIRRVLS